MVVTDYTDKKILAKYEKKTENHPLVLYPAFFKEMGNLKGKKVLDIGCGNGYFTAQMAKQGAKVIGIDTSEEWIERCRQKYVRTKNVAFIKMDASNLGAFKKSTFDIVTCCMVLLNVEPKSKVEKIMAESARVLKKEGKFIFSDLHPFVIMTKIIPSRRQILPKGFSYFKDGDSYNAIKLDKHDFELVFKNRHWTFESYCKMLENAGLYLHSIVEPPYAKNAPKNFRDYKVPEYILFNCRKL